MNTDLSNINLFNAIPKLKSALPKAMDPPANTAPRWDRSTGASYSTAPFQSHSTVRAGGSSR